MDKKYYRIGKISKCNKKELEGKYFEIDEYNYNQFCFAFESFKLKFKDVEFCLEVDKKNEEFLVYVYYKENKIATFSIFDPKEAFSDSYINTSIKFVNEKSENVEFKIDFVEKDENPEPVKKKILFADSASKAAYYARINDLKLSDFIVIGKSYSYRAIVEKIEGIKGKVEIYVFTECFENSFVDEIEVRNYKDLMLKFLDY